MDCSPSGREMDVRPVQLRNASLPMEVNWLPVAKLTLARSLHPWNAKAPIERTLAGSKFNMRVDECRSAAYALKALSGMSYGKFEETNLRDVPREVFDTYGDRLPEPWRRRALHWYTEFDRVTAGVAAWRRGDIAAFGSLSFESGRSSIDSWETGSPELKELYEIMTRTDGIYGGRFSGAGFKGCCMALIDPAYENEILARVEKDYLCAFPALRGKYSAHICETADGVKL